MYSAIICVNLLVSYLGLNINLSSIRSAWGKNDSLEDQVYDTLFIVLVLDLFNYCELKGCRFKRIT